MELPCQDGVLRLEWSLAGRSAAISLSASIKAGTASEMVALNCLRARLDEDAGHIDAAIEHYTEALSLQPNAPQVHAELARIHLLSLDLDKSKAHLKKSMMHQRWTRVIQGQSSNKSQSQIGRILDDFCIEKDGLAELKKVSAIPARTRIPHICDIIRHYPGYTAAASQLLLAIRQDGWIDRRPSGGNPIPRTIVQYWDDEAIPADLRCLSETWTRQNPEHRHLKFNNASALKFLTERYSTDVTSAYLRAREPAQKADIFRLAYLYAEGGYYADMDDRCLLPSG